MRPRVSITAVIVLMCWVTAVAVYAQAPGRPANPFPENPATHNPVDLPFGDTTVGSGRGVLVVEVLNADQSLLTRQALVKVRSDLKGWESWDTTRERSEVTFQGLTPGAYSVEVSAAGYATGTERVYVEDALGPNRLRVVLKPSGYGDVISPPPVSLIPAKARRDAERGIAALKAGKLNDAEKHLAKACKRAPDSADLNYLLGVLFWQKKALGQAQSYLAKAVAYDARHVPALTALGAVMLQQENPTGAIKNLEQAISVDSNAWMAHWLLANGYLEQREFEKARQQAQAAIQTGKGAGSAAQLPLGQAMASLGRTQEAIAALEGFLRDVPASPAAPQVRSLIAQLRTAAARNDAVRPASVPPPAVTVVPEPRLALPNWGPPGVDETQPPVAAGVECPTQNVLAGARRRVVELVGDLSRFEAREEIVHQDLDEFGKPLTHESRKYSYVAAFVRLNPGVPKVDEYRRTVSGTGSFPGNIASLGLPGLVFIFHPDLQENYAFTCEGLGEWQGQATWLVHFRQRENRPSYLQAYIVGPKRYAVDLKGRVWVAASSYHVVHMEAELIRPMPELRLLTQHVLVDYGLVTFPKKNTSLWLPKSAELYFHFQGHRYHRRHTFDNFRLFHVEVTQKVGEPKTSP